MAITAFQNTFNNLLSTQSGLDFLNSAAGQSFIEANEINTSGTALAPQTSTTTTSDLSGTSLVPSAGSPTVNADGSPLTLEQTLLNSINNPTVPAGAQLSATPVSTAGGTQEVVQVEGDIAIPEPTAVTVEPVDTATFDPALAGEAPQIDAAVGEVSPEAQAQAQIGVVPEEAIVTAPQALSADIIEAAQSILTPEQLASIDPAVLPQLIEAIQGTISDDFTAAIEQGIADIREFPVDPRATVQEQFRMLMDFEPGEIPDWAKGAVLAAKADAAKRGISASSIAASNISMGLLQAALPIAQQDATFFATINLRQFDAVQQTTVLKASHIANLDIQNLQNRQTVAIQNAQNLLNVELSNLDARTQEAIQNANAFLTTALQNTGFQQQANIENARNSLNINLANLDAETRAALQNAQSFLTIESQNLNNRQQTAVFNAKAFLDMDFANLSNEQQTSILNAQSRIQFMLSDQAAINAALQFNTASENEMNTFFASLIANIDAFNSAQATDVFSFNASMQDARERFNVEMEATIEAGNVNFLRQVNLADAAAINQANFFNAQSLLEISNTAMANALTLLRDEASFTFQSTENTKERAFQRALAELQIAADKDAQKAIAKFNKSAAIGSFIGGLFDDVIGSVLAPPATESA